MQKKIVLTISVLLSAALLGIAYFAFVAPKTQTGAKTVTIQIVIPPKELQKTFTYHTDRTYVAELLKDKANELQPQTKNSQYGEYLTAMLGIKADASKEYYHIQVNGKDAITGISQLLLEDGKTYTFTLTPF